MSAANGMESIGVALALAMFSRRRNDSPPREPTARDLMHAEIAAHNKAVDQRKAEKAARKAARRNGAKP